MGKKQKEIFEENTKEISNVKAKVNIGVASLVYFGVIIWAFFEFVFDKSVNTNAMGYVMMFFFIIFPVAGFACSCAVGLQDVKGKWIFSIIYVILCAGFVTFVTSELILIYLVVGILPNILGFIFGGFCCKMKKRKEIAE